MIPVSSSPVPGNWRKSSYSGQDGDCVEAGSAAGAVLIRDTKDRDGPALAFTPGGWRSFTVGLKQ